MVGRQQTSRHHQFGNMAADPDKNPGLAVLLMKYLQGSTVGILLNFSAKIPPKGYEKITFPFL